MGKTTGFIDYDRVDAPERAPAERVKDYSEFHLRLSERQRREQGGRCMDCGVPFCQAGIVFDGERLGCPLHNLIPEWNDMLWLGNMEHALSRLQKVNCFPEFTGRVCPAPCERACSCGINGKSVAVRDNELYIIEYAFENSLIAPAPPAVRSGKRVAVVGSGPAGLACAYYLNRRGHNVTVFEKDVRPGGLLMYGIPAMKLDKSVVDRRVELMEREGVVFTCGTDVGRDIPLEELENSFDAIVLCCGARKPRSVAFDGDVHSGICYALDYLSGEIRVLRGESGECVSASGKRVAVVGAGDSASDCIATALRQGCKSVTQIIRKSAQAYSGAPDYAHREAEALFKKDIRIFESSVKAVAGDGNGDLKQIILKTPDGDTPLDAELLIIASGFSGAEDYSAKMAASSQGSRSVFSAGDMRTGASLVVLAIADGKQAAADVDSFLMGYTNIV